MKQHTSDFKDIISKIGRKFDDVITVHYSSSTATLRSELSSVSLHYESGLLKSIMKQLDIVSTYEIPVGTRITYSKGLLVNNANEYLDYGDFYVYKVEKSEDEKTYNITCYDKMLFSMVEYDGISATFPMTVKNYINALCTKIGIPFISSSSTFANQNRQMQNDPYVDSEGNSLGYTIRDIFDELSQVTASNICIGKANNVEGLEVRYFTNTNDTIDESFLKDTNVNFGEKYGPINSIVLSRAESDNVYLQDETSVTQNGLCEIKIKDNQIMNFDDRSDYLPDILNKLDGLEYYPNDYLSTGICYYEPCDIYEISIGNETYKCVMLNDEINTTTGLEELVHTEIPEEAKTDYTKADKTDRRINQTNLVVDKHNQEITALVTKTDEFDETITQLQIDVNGISSQVSGMYDLVRTAEGITTLTLDPCMEGELLELHIYGNNSVFEQLYPLNDLYPADDLYPYGSSEIEVEDEDENVTTYNLGITEVLRANSEAKDEYVLKDNQASIIRRVNANGTTKQTEVVEDLGELIINVKEGTNTITLKEYNAQMQAKFIIKNNYTDQFTTQIQTQSKIEQSSNQILLEVSEQYETKGNANYNYSRLTQTANEISTEVSKKVGNDEVISKINQSAEAVTINANKISLSGKTINLTSDNMAISSTNFSVDSSGNMACSNANFTGGKVNLTGGSRQNPNLSVAGTNSDTEILPSSIYLDFNNNVEAGAGGLYIHSSNPSDSNLQALFYCDENGGGITLGGRVSNDITLRAGSTPRVVCGGYMEATEYRYSSDARLKKDIKKYNFNALNMINNSDIYKYKFKKSDKEEFGLVIGEGYRTPKELIECNEDGKYSINAYKMNAVLWKAIQEQQQQIEDLKNEINSLKGENNG